MSDPATFIIHPAAEEEAAEAARWYGERSARAAAEFVEEVNRAIDIVRAAPRRWPIGLHGTRRFLLRRFPFALVYRELPSAIQLLAVAHGRRLPGYWKNRL
jgi:plasmid stabilization system protein ParE